LVIKIDMQGSIPIYEQIRNKIILGIASGKLTAGEQLPSVRRLAADLGINFHTVNKAYTALCDEGYLVIDRRKGAMVAQPPIRDDPPIAKTRLQLIQVAAEGIVHGMDEEMFVALCTQCYRDAKENN